ncbi:hypothetical protein HKD37_07G019521 [Glycine soja]
MATPPSSPPPPSPPPPTEAASQFPSTLKRTRKATRLRSLATRPAGADRSVVHVDPTIGKADGPHKKKLRTYLGIVARDKVDAEFDIPEASDVRTKKKILQTVGPTRTIWMTLFTKNTTLAKRNGPNFVRAAETPRGRYKNTAPHVLSHGGYEYLEQKLMVEKTKKKMEEAAQSESTEALIDPLSPIRRHVKWKRARTKKIGQMTYEATKEILEKIESQGSFVPHGRQDVLIAAIGQPEHPGRVHAAGAGVTMKQYFESAPRTSRTSSSMDSKELEQLTQQIRDQLEESIIEKGLALPPEPEFGPSAAHVSTKESCIDPSGNDPDMGDSDKYGLYIEENPPCLVALGRVYEGSITVHNIPLLHDQVKVDVEEVKNANAPVPGAVGPAKPGDRPDHDVDDPLYLMTLTIPQLFLKPLQVMWDATVFGVFNQDFPLYIKHEDLSKIAHCGQYLSISVIQLWLLHLTETSMRVGNSDSTQRSGQSQFESESYMKNWMQNSKRDVYLGAYLNGLDNYLKGIINRSVLFFNTFALALLSNVNILMFLVFNNALKGLDNTPQPKSKAGARWIVVKYFNDVRPLEAERLKAFRIQWTQYYLKTMY